MMQPFPEVPSLELIAKRLFLIFPEGTEFRNYVLRDIAVKTIFVMFYAGAIVGTERWIRPSQVTDMNDEQAAKRSEAARVEWENRSLSSNKVRPTESWYAPNSREPIRDETIRTGFMLCQAVIERADLPTTSPKPKYAMEPEFAALFNATLNGAVLDQAIEKWQASHLTKNALTRLQLIKQSGFGKTAELSVTFPNGEKRMLSPGQSSVIARAVIEVFAPRFLKQPVVLWLSESGNKMVARDDELAKRLGIRIDVSKALPDIILVDLGEHADGSDMMVVFVEVVATDGPIHRERKAILTAHAREANFNPDDLAFLSAYMDRAVGPFKKNVSELAWGSYAWFVAEPDQLIALIDEPPGRLSDLRASARSPAKPAG